MNKKSNVPKLLLMSMEKTIFTIINRLISIVRYFTMDYIVKVVNNSAY